MTTKHETKAALSPTYMAGQIDELRRQRDTLAADNDALRRLINTLRRAIKAIPAEGFDSRVQSKVFDACLAILAHDARREKP